MNAEEEVTNRVQDWQKRVGETARNVSQATDRYVHDNAWASVAFAAVIGGVIGYLLGSRSED